LRRRITIATTMFCSFTTSKLFKKLFSFIKKKLRFYLNKEAKIYFSKIGLLNQLKLSKNNIPADFLDLKFLYKLIVNKKVSTVLEFGAGYSTLVMAEALKFNSKYNINTKIYILESEKKWIKILKKKLIKYTNYKIIYSKCNMHLVGMTPCHVYRNLPNITPDLIYLDGPDPSSIKSKIFNLNYQKDNNPMSADVLLYEYKLKPGAMIVVDGRQNNVIFLKNNLKRKYKCKYYRLCHRTTFTLLY
jgi:hypothetical protein